MWLDTRVGPGNSGIVTSRIVATQSFCSGRDSSDYKRNLSIFYCRLSSTAC